MKKKIISIIMAFIVMLSAAVTASAEGFIYNFDETAANPGPHCKSLFMVNVDTGSIVYSMNPDEMRSMASLTKIMSFIIASEYIPDIYNTLITVPSLAALEGTNSSVADIKVGEEFIAHDLLYLMMVPSGNDAALTLASYVDSLGITKRSIMAKNASSSGELSSQESSSENSSEEDSSTETDEDEDLDTPLTFVDLMNMKAEELGCYNTHFENPHGLYDQNHYTTAREMMEITLYAMSLPDFTEICRTSVYYLPQTNMREKGSSYRVTTNSMLLENETDYYYRYATGIKTGSLDQSGYCIASSAVYMGYTYVIIALDSEYVDENGEHVTLHGEMLDCKELFKWAFTSLEMKAVATSGQIMGDVTLRYAWNQDKLQVAAADNVNAILPSNVEQSSVISKLELPEHVDAPIKRGDVIGKATLTYADEIIATVDLVATESVERSDIVMTLEQGKAVFTSGWFLIVVAIIAVLIIVYIILVIMYRNKQKHLKKVNRGRFRDM